MLGKTEGAIKNGQSRETGNIGFFLLLTESVSGCCLTPNKQCVSYTMATTSYNGNMSLGGLVLFDLYFSVSWFVLFLLAIVFPSSIYGC